MGIEQKNRELLKEQGDFIRKSLAPTFDDIKDEIIKGKRAQMGEVREWGGVKMRKEANGWIPVREGGEKPKAEGEGGGEQKPQDIGEAAKSASEGALQNAIKLSNDPKVREAAHRELERRKNEEAQEQFKAPDDGDGDKKKERIEGKNGFTDKSGEWHDTDNPRGDVRYQEKMKEEGRKNYEKEYAQPGSQAAEEQKKEDEIKIDSDLVDKFKKLSPEAQKRVLDDMTKEKPKNDLPEEVNKMLEGMSSEQRKRVLERAIKIGEDIKKEESDNKEKTKPVGKKLNTVSETYSWGNLVRVENGNSWKAIFFPEDIDKIKKLDEGKSVVIQDEQGDHWNVTNNGDGFNIEGVGRTSSNYKGNFKLEDAKEEKGRTSDDIKREISEAPIGSKASGGGYSEWEKVGKDSWHNKSTNSLSHDDGIFSRIGKFDDFKIKNDKSEIKKGEKKYSGTESHIIKNKIIPEVGIKLREAKFQSPNYQDRKSIYSYGYSTEEPVTDKQIESINNILMREYPDRMFRVDNLGDKIRVSIQRDGIKDTRSINQMKQWGMKKGGEDLKKSEDGEGLYKSLLLQNIEDQDLIEKSHINEFVYNEDMKVSKTGKELKEKFQEQIKEEVEEIREYSIKMQELLQKIGKQPTKKVDEIWYYRVDGWEDKLPIMPMVFGDGYPSINEVDESGVKGDKYEYDQLVGRLIDCNIEIIMLNTMINNMKDSKEYKLTVRQAAMLGF